MASRKESKPAAPDNQNGGQPEYPFKLASSDGQDWGEAAFLKAHERLDINDKRYQDWYYKLGAMLRDQLFPKSDRVYYLEALPDHYHLRRKIGKDDRHDIYLYGYPGTPGTKPKSYRNPVDFFPHVLWLAGGSTDRGDCSCSLCNPPPKTQPAIQQKAMPAVSASGPPLSGPLTTSAAPSPVPVTAVAPKLAVKKSAITASSTKVKPTTTTAAAATSKAPTRVATPPTQRNATPVLAPVVSSRSQHHATVPPSPQMLQPQADEPVLFREGEIVWYKNNNAWRIGMVLKAVPADPVSSTPAKSLIRPLAHAYLTLENVVKFEADMRPFLAFSVPNLNPIMQHLSGQTMSSIDWRTLPAQLAGNDTQKQEAIGLEASKLAAMCVDHSYSTFNPVTIPQVAPDRQRFGGVFLGAEKIRVYEAVRIRLQPQEQNPNWNKIMPIVMVIKDIFICNSDGGEHLFFHGDIWRLEETAAQHHAPNQEQLPAAMRREKAFRDEVKKGRGTHFDWIPVLNNVTKDETAIRGRFYETQKLAPILNPVMFNNKDLMEKGVVGDVQAYLNNRRDSSGSYIGRKRNRADAVAGAVPEGFFISFGPGVVEAS